MNQTTLFHWDPLAILTAVHSHASTSRSREDARMETSVQIATAVYGEATAGTGQKNQPVIADLAFLQQGYPVNTREFDLACNLLVRGTVGDM